ncbi:glycosyltransferase involved in cell wall biosynthesis [Variovorax paradoxus]|jgi:glycosyltransferase involved in cell wall biosynthesis|uniref:glycosyltransferase family 2 protein n=1 Tax=Variovorax paradoxus TaxID=34073 RepID=UPI00277E6190|nr:glycosyltransferase family 2 protein [Variovorax paradoxus]MDP9933572.1 glycosyltransferase involved in cell wall biosynthesis [Variovorax paradoxus]MDQ0027944.1 glycosyltransferase involved in cell wall biosynthesis [Variovorax paradoxus]
MTDDHNHFAAARAPLRIAAVIPCYNEALSIAQVVAQFRAALPEAEIHVFDNNSSDDTAAIARESGAFVTHVAAAGKGNVVRRMFADVEADVYVTVDGDATYDVASAPRLVDLLVERNLDMVVGCRVDDGQNALTYRAGHRFGNRMLTGAVAQLFGGGLTDMLSGYRVFSRRYAKSFPALSHGFEIETELTVHALELRMPYAEVDTTYSTRPEGSHSKLSTYRDGWRILRTICKLFISERPLQFFTILAAVLAVGAIALVIPLLVTYLHTGLVPRLPTAVLATGAMLAAMLSMVCGVVMHAIRLGRREAKRLRYLATPGVRHFAGK